MKIKKYQKKFDFSYCFGAYPNIDLLNKYPKEVMKVILKEGGLESDGVDEVIRLCKINNIPYEVNDHLIEKIAFKENTYVVGVFKKFEKVLSKDSNHLVLVNPKNMGNIGTIIRTMVAFGFKDLAIIRPAADIFDPKVVRSAMGALFHINFKYYTDFEEYSNEFNTHNLFPFMLDGGKNIDSVNFKSPYSLIFGNESQGLPDEFQKVGQSVFIPQSEDVDSLNLSVSVAISLYLASR
jgi:TrmH family RNA methyltransferase